MVNFIRNVVKSLKQRYGTSVQYQRVDSNDFDPTTGQRTIQKETWTIEKAIVSPKTGIRDFAYDLSFIAANKNFTYGAMFDPSTRLIIMDLDDLPSSLTPTVNDYLFIENNRYQIKEIDNCDGTALLIKATHVDGDGADNVVRVSAQTDLGINQTVGVEIE